MVWGGVSERGDKMKIIIIFVLLLFTLTPLAKAEWLLDGKSVTNKSYAKTQGEFGAMLFFTDRPNELFARWNKNAEETDIGEVASIKQNASITALIIFSNCLPDKNGMANVSVKFIAYTPDGEKLTETKEVEVWINKPAPPKRILELGVDFLQLTIKNDYPKGTYLVKALVHDKNSNKKIELERTFEVW